jgi:hypothetical protein
MIAQPQLEDWIDSVRSVRQSFRVSKLRLATIMVPSLHVIDNGPNGLKDPLHLSRP